MKIVKAALFDKKGAVLAGGAELSPAGADGCPAGPSPALAGERPAVRTLVRAMRRAPLLQGASRGRRSGRRVVLPF